MSTPYPVPVPILGADGKISEDQLPPVAPSDPATAELVSTDGTLTRAAVLALLGDAVTTAELNTILAGFIRPVDLAPYATDTELAAKQDRLPWADVVYDPVAGWANPGPPAGAPAGWHRRFDSARHAAAPEPPSFAGVHGDRWLPHPLSPIYAQVA